MIPKQQTFLITAALFCINTIHAQFSSFDLSKYQTADYQRKELVFSGDLSGNYSESKEEDYSSSYNKVFNSNFAIYYNQVKNTRKTQKNVLLNLSSNPVNYNFSSQQIEDPMFYEKIKNEEHTNTGAISFESSYRKYFKSNTFYEIDIIGNFSALHQRKDDNQTGNPDFQTSDGSIRYLIGNLKVPFKLGVGRIENVEDAKMAIFILEALHENQQLLKEINDEDILLFAEKITQLKNKRHFDSRKRRIYEIQSLDSFIREKGMVSSQNAVYYSNLIDNWGYANNPLRQSGTRFSFGIAPVVNYYIVKYLSQGKNSILSPGINFAADLKSEKPLNLKWQQSAGITTEYTRLENRLYSGSSEYDYSSDQIFLSAYAGYGYYPNSRSYHQIALSPYAVKTWNKWDDSRLNNVKNKWNCGTNLTLRGYIYFSERLFANYNIAVNYSENKEKTEIETSKSNNFGTSFNLSFAYSIF